MGRNNIMNWKTVKKSIMLGMSLLFCISITACSGGKQTSQKGESSWTIKRTIENKARSVTVAGFLNPSHGISVGQSGETWYTTDGGDNWTKGENESFCRYGLRIMDEKVAWSCGNRGNIRMTKDGGKTWLKLTDFGGEKAEPNNEISFINDTLGWSSSKTRLMKTEDGGNTWSDVKLPEGMKKITAIQLIDKDKGYIFDTSGTLFATTDGGENWTSKPSNLEISFDTSYNIGPSVCIQFLDNQKGFIAYKGKDQNTCLASTEDGGASWEKVSLPKVEWGYMYLSTDAKTLTVTSLSDAAITVLSKK
jgi:photosystem II stability/assembly factor-like uncharacterized protein